jgi:hypothetical protein
MQAEVAGQEIINSHTSSIINIRLARRTAGFCYSQCFKVLPVSIVLQVFLLLFVGF